MIDLEQKRENLQNELNRLDERIRQLHGAFAQQATLIVSAPKRKRPAKARATGTKRVRGLKKTSPAAARHIGNGKGAGRTAKRVIPGKPGSLRDRILRELKSVGQKGITVKDLAHKLGTNYRNIFVWFVTTGKKNPAIKKVGEARYKLQS
jgi:hypothetical protein